MRWLIDLVRSKSLLIRQRDAAIEARKRFVDHANEGLAAQRTAYQRREAGLQHVIRLLEEKNAYLSEQLATYRDSLASFQAEAQLRGALAKADTLALTHPRPH